MMVSENLAANQAAGFSSSCWLYIYIYKYRFYGGASSLERTALALHFPTSPKIDGLDLGRPRFTIDDLRAQDHFNVFHLCRWALGANGLQQIGVGEELACGDGAAASNPRGHERGFAGGVIGEARDDRIIPIVICGDLLPAVHNPARLPGLRAIDNAEHCHVRIVGEVEPE